MSDAPIHRGSAFTTLSASYARVDIDRALPCIVFLVHGVNDNGVAYEAQDQGLCAGLNARLNRGASLTRPGGDLHHYDFANADTPKKYDALLAKLDKTDPARAERLRSDPDAVLFRPGAIPGQTYSPVIPFYWGYREQEGINPDTRKPYIDREHWHGQWLDRWGNRLDKDGAKEGGPFINATSNLPDCWSDGQGPGMAGLLDALKRDAMRPMKGAPNRRYFVLAARRLAMLIRLVRNQPETRHAAVNLVAHSQGCMISLLAQAMLAEDGVQPADTLILQNPPYSLEEPTLEFTGSAKQTTVARLQTLVNLVRFVHEKAQSSPSLADVHAGVPRHGVAGPHWAPGTARKVVDA
uniref:T6SS effector phospholipase Tle3 domain-containing protein n=1 Tax=Derxia gummosa DSM 723 TaxID=1121388 RepID=A0AC36KLM7_9BURK